MHASPWRSSARARLFSIGALALLLVGCAPLVRPATFVGARDQITDATLIGPFDGQVVDISTGEPVAEAVVVGVWAYDRGDGFIGPYGSETYSTTTDAAGRYRIDPAKLTVRASSLRLVSFHLVVYKRGYAGYRSDARISPEGGGARTDFAVRHNKVELRKWRETDSHAEHLLFLASPKTLRKTTAWEQDLANLDLFREHGGAGGTAVALPETGETPTARDPEWLDAGAVLSPDEVRARTHYTDAFEVEDLPDLARTDFYHGVHLRAQGRDEPWDIAYRVWRSPPGGMDPVVSTIQETMAGVKPTAEITPETWLLSAEGVHAVAFVDREAQVGVLLSCGDQQCVDLETAIILAKTLQRNLDRLRSVPAPKPAAAKPSEPLAPQTPGTRGRLPSTPATGNPPAGSSPTPTGTKPTGTPTGTPPSGTTPTGTKPSGTTPSGTTPSGTKPSGTPAGTTPTGTTPTGTPTGTTATGTRPNGAKRGRP